MTRREPALLVTACILLAVLVGPARADGGFTSVSWGFATVALSAFALAVLLSREVRLGRLELLAVAAFALFAAWTAVSLLWTSSVPLTMLELEHTLLPLAALVASVAAIRSGTAWILAGVVFVLALALALQALRSGVAVPLGYANSLALLSVIGMLLSGGWALEHRGAVAVAAVPALCLFAVVIVQSESRGAWPALLGGIAVSLALRSRRPALTTFGTFAVAGGTIALLAVWASEQRSAYWGTTLHAIARQPLLGSGPGTWSRVWLEHRDVDNAAQNAHSLYLEVLSELGPVGLALLLVGLLVPLGAAVRARRRRYVPTITAAYAAFLLHQAVDWDWRLSEVLLSGVLLGAALLGEARSEARAASVAVPRLLGALALVALLLFGTVTWIGGALTSRAAEHLRSGEWAAALADATRAHRVAPWAAEPWLLRGQAELAEGRRAQALQSFRRGLELDETDVALWEALSRVSSGVERRRALVRVALLDPRGVGAGVFSG